MKKISLLIIAILSTLMLNAQQTTKTYNLQNLTAIDAEGVFNINLTRGTSDTIKVTGPDELMQYLSVVQEKNVVKFSLANNGKKIKLKKIEGSLNVYMQLSELYQVELSGSCTLNGLNNTFPSQKFECELSGASELSNISISSERSEFDLSGASKAVVAGSYGATECDLSGASSITMKGVAKSMSVDASGASQANIDNVQGNFINVKSSGASTVSITNISVKKVSADVSGTGKVEMSGNTTSLNLKGSGAADINTKELYSTNVKSDLSGASSATARCSGKLETKTSSGAKLDYFGSPTQIVSVSKNIKK